MWIWSKMCNVTTASPQSAIWTRIQEFYWGIPRKVGPLVNHLMSTWWESGEMSHDCKIRQISAEDEKVKNCRRRKVTQQVLFEVAFFFPATWFSISNFSWEGKQNLERVPDRLAIRIQLRENKIFPDLISDKKYTFPKYKRVSRGVWKGHVTVRVIQMWWEWDITCHVIKANWF